MHPEVRCFSLSEVLCVPSVSNGEKKDKFRKGILLTDLNWTASY